MNEKDRTTRFDQIRDEEGMTHVSLRGSAWLTQEDECEGEEDHEPE